MTKVITLPIYSPDMPVHDNTMLSAHNRCNYLYWLQFIRNKRRGSSAALDYGSFMHLLYSTWYDLMVNEVMEPMKAIEAVVSIGQKAHYANYADDHRTRERGILQFLEYANHYGWMEKSRGWRIIFAETGFRVQLDHFPYGGKIDLLIEWDKRLWIVDHKTTSRFGDKRDAQDRYYRQFVPDTQTCGYVKSGEVLHGKKIAGVIINLSVIHKVRKPPEQQFFWRAFEYPEFYFDEWENQVEDELELIRKNRQDNHFRQRWQNCTDKWGQCMAFDLCRSLPENRERILEQNWEDYHWDYTKIEVPEQPKEDDSPLIFFGE